MSFAPARACGRVFHLLWGDGVDPALRGMLLASLTATIASSSVYPFIGIWLIKDVHAGESSIGLAYLVGAVLAGGLSVTAGHLSDRAGRRPVMLLGAAIQALVPLGLLFARSRAGLALGLLVMLPVAPALWSAAAQSLVADLIPPERHADGYGSVRVVRNLGVAIGPPLGGILLAGGSWQHLWLGALTVSAAAALISFRFIPRGGTSAPPETARRSSFATIVRDRPYALFMVSSVLATMTYAAIETLLPISATTSHHLAPAAYGFVALLDPLAITLFQIRLTRLAAPIRPSIKLAVAMPLMGMPFLFLSVDGSIATIAAITLVFVVGEMLWQPTTQAAAVSLAPDDLRGAYMGAFAGTTSIGFAVTPFLGLKVHEMYGDNAMWWCVAGVGILAGSIGLLALRRRDAVPAAAATS
jgi:predicted MFS family arabinose efflux permease